MLLILFGNSYIKNIYQMAPAGAKKKTFRREKRTALTRAKPAKRLHLNSGEYTILYDYKVLKIELLTVGLALNQCRLMIIE